MQHLLSRWACDMRERGVVFWMECVQGRRKEGGEGGAGEMGVRDWPKGQEQSRSVTSSRLLRLASQAVACILCRCPTLTRHQALSWLQTRAGITPPILHCPIAHHVAGALSHRVRETKEDTE